MKVAMETCSWHSAITLIKFPYSDAVHVYSLVTIAIEHTLPHKSIFSVSVLPCPSLNRIHKNQTPLNLYLVNTQGCE